MQLIKFQFQFKKKLINFFSLRTPSSETSLDNQFWFESLTIKTKTKKKNITKIFLRIHWWTSVFHMLWLSLSFVTIFEPIFASPSCFSFSFVIYEPISAFPPSFSFELIFAPLSCSSLSFRSCSSAILLIHRLAPLCSSARRKKTKEK